MFKKFFAVFMSLFLGLGFCLFVYALVTNKLDIGYNQGYTPTQPIAFSHAVHAGKHQIDCRYCHVGVELYKTASIPSLNICMNCHLSIKTDSKLIQKMTKLYQNNESIHWKRVNLLPDHVKFQHAPHIQAGKDCLECHGAVEKEEELKQYKAFSMGECVNCHRKKENNAPVNCSTCHY